MADALTADAVLHSVLVAAAVSPAVAVDAGVGDGAGDGGDSVADGAKIAQSAESKQNALSIFTIHILKRPSILHLFDQCLITDHAFGVPH